MDALNDLVLPRTIVVVLNVNIVAISIANRMKLYASDVGYHLSKDGYPCQLRYSANWRRGGTKCSKIEPHYQRHQKCIPDMPFTDGSSNLINRHLSILNNPTHVGSPQSDFCRFLKIQPELAATAAGDPGRPVDGVNTIGMLLTSAKADTEAGYPSIPTEVEVTEGGWVVQPPPPLYNCMYVVDGGKEENGGIPIHCIAQGSSVSQNCPFILMILLSSW
eukprot:Gb_34909 [translate_table: standard]